MREETAAEGKPLTRLRPAFWTLADQGVVSLGTFLTGILLARALSPLEFGIYALVFGLSLTLYSLHAALVIYPLTVRGAALEPESLRRLCGAALTGALLLALPTVLALSIGVIALGRPELAPWVSAAATAWLAQETLRRAQMTRLRHAAALPGDSLSYLGQTAVIGLASAAGQLSLEVAFAIMTVTSTLAAVLQFVQVRPARFQHAELAGTIQHAWRIGRWALPSYLLGAAIIQAFPWLLALTDGTVATARFQAAVNLLGATNPVMYGIGNLLVPLVGLTAARNGPLAAIRSARAYLLIGGAVLIPYFALLTGWPDRVLRAVYGSDSPYIELEATLRLLVVGFALIYAAHVLGATLYGLERSRAVLVSQLACGAAILLAGVPLTLWLGVPGAALGVMAAHGARAAISAWLLSRAGTGSASSDVIPRDALFDRGESGTIRLKPLGEAARRDNS